MKPEQKHAEKCECKEPDAIDVLWSDEIVHRHFRKIRLRLRAGCWSAASAREHRRRASNTAADIRSDAGSHADRMFSLSPLLRGTLLTSSDMRNLILDFGIWISKAKTQKPPASPHRVRVRSPHVSKGQSSSGQHGSTAARPVSALANDNVALTHVRATDTAGFAKLPSKLQNHLTQ